MAADSGLESCPSPEITDSRKRPLDGDSENGDAKRSHFSSVQDLVMALPLANGHNNNMTSHFGSDPSYHFKVLIPAMVAGAIIGKGGETIAQLQKETGARVKMSKSHDFYPGTTERACLITGSVEAIVVVLDFIMEKIKEKPELVKPFAEVDAKMPQDRDKQVKILVPNSTAGMIIGKGGNYIKQIKEASGSYVQISQKAQDVTLPERCITVIGDKEANKKACMMILAKVVDDPQSGSCPNVSYADVSGPVANFNPTGSPYARTTQVETSISLGSAGSVLLNGGASPVGALNLTLSLAPPGTKPTSPITQQLFEYIRSALRTIGYCEADVTEIGGAIALLSKYGGICPALSPFGTAGAPLTATTPLSYIPALAAAAAASTADPTMFAPFTQVGLGMYDGGSVSERFAEVALEAAFRPSAVAPVQAYAPLLNAAAAINKSPTPGDTGAKDAKNVEVAEVIVGAILGPGGRSLNEIQQLSGAKVQISKKGTFAPGTRNRIVTITGSANAISNAHYIIEQKIQEEELKRTRHNAVSGLIQ